ncbi:MAG: benzoyl-CoA-dihydrodiol lyase [Deltaproteobacteria bacterium]|nr:MAG: benzoyl-CoA-dihydrodiol lyase [Deltaproteobacteria bacterium]
MGTDVKIQHIPSFAAHPSAYRHWTLRLDGPVARLALNIDERNGLRPDDYLLKLNSYDLGVDLELHDAVERLRFEHPEVRAVIVTSDMPRIFCAGANIRMLASSTHGFKVNFCKYTNETRVGMEEASEESGQRYLAALNGTASGGGYELALACDEILLIDDGTAAVSLPEVPLLGVLPGTGGLTRLVDKRYVRRDLADLFCTKAEGFRARDAVKYRLVDQSFPRSKWEDGVAARAAEVAQANPARDTKGVELPPIQAQIDDDGRRLTYSSVTVQIDPEQRTASLTIHGPQEPAPADAAALRDQGAQTWGFRAFRELEDALLHLRFNYDTIGVITVHTSGDAERVLAHDAVLHDHAGDWFADELRWYRARVLRRVDNTARTFFALIDEGSCFVGTLFELAQACDRQYMLEDDDGEVRIQLNLASEGLYPMSTGMSRLQARYIGHEGDLRRALEATEPLTGPDAEELGLVTLCLDDIDFEDEVRIAIEERVSLSPDALTGMEQNLRFVGAENCQTKIYGRLSAWQNWIFQRPNAVGETGALSLFGHPERPEFDWRRT